MCIYQSSMCGNNLASYQSYCSQPAMAASAGIIGQWPSAYHLNLGNGGGESGNVGGNINPAAVAAGLQWQSMQ